VSIRSKLLGAVCLGLAATAMMPAYAAEPFAAGDWFVRGRILGVMPDEKSTISAIGGKAHAENTVVPEVDISYFLSNSVSLELIAAITKHDVEARGTTLGTVPLGSAWLLPPTLTLQYHATIGSLSPYVGVGLNYTHVFDADPPAAGAVRTISYGDSFGPALQAGVDVWLNDTWTLNVDVKKVWLNTDVKINGGAITADVDLNPWLLGVGFGYKF
jgi:outer membrane protein